MQGFPGSITMEETWNKETREAYLEGRHQALSEVLMVLTPGKNYVWDHLKFGDGDLIKYIKIIAKEHEDRLMKAKDIHRAQQKFIKKLSQLTVN